MALLCCAVACDGKDTNKRARNMKFTSLFFKASASIFGLQPKVPNKRARNMKFTSLFFKASADYLRFPAKNAVINGQKA